MTTSITKYELWSKLGFIGSYDSLEELKKYVDTYKELPCMSIPLKVRSYTTVIEDFIPFEELD